MKKQILSKGIIEDFSITTSEDIVKRLTLNCNDLVGQVINDLITRYPSITNNKIILINEFATRTATSTSSFDLLLIIKSAEIETITNKTRKKSIKKMLSNFFQNFKLKRKKRKNLKKDAEKKLNDISFERYDYFEMKKSLFYLITKYADKSSIIYNYPYYIKLKSANNSEIPIKIYPVLENETGTYTLFNDKNNKSVNIDINDRFLNIINSIKATNGKSLNLLRILNCAYNYLYNESPNQIYTESLIYNCPFQLYDSKTIYDSFVLLVNYIDNIDPNKLTSITGTNKLFNDNLNTISSIRHFDFFKKLKQLI